ncbi:peptide ABC transporter substrate-binding protein [Aeromonas diversa]|uniref:peptide ABC transporter substrate-binding protein n=1 Tax=Aeromonas diversa TaxID=502790 RepID=UPI0039A2ECA9
MCNSRLYGLVILVASQLLAAEPVAVPAPQPERQTLVRGNGGEPDSLDPAQVRNGFPGEAILTDLFEGLVAEDGEGQIVPAQALRWEQSDDGLVWRFFLRPELRWSNGERLTASDFVYAWRRLIDPATASASASLMLATGINNAAAIYGGALEPKDLGVDAESELVLRVTLERPVPYLLRLLSQRPFVPINEEAVARFGRAWTEPGHMVSNGAYRLSAWIPDERIELTRNGEYWDHANTRIEQVTYLPLPSLNAERLGYEAGKIHMTHGVQSEYYSRIREEAPDRLWGLPLFGTYLYSFNLKRPELARVEVRRALSLAIDREVLTQYVAGQGEQIAWSVLPAQPGYASMADADAALPRAERLKQAAELLKQAGFGPDHPLRLSIAYNTSEHHKKLAVAVAAMWKPLGVEVALRDMQWNVYQEAKAAGDFTIARTLAFGDYVEPSALLSFFRCGEQQNESGYCNRAYDALLEQAVNTLDLTERTRLYQEAERKLLADQPVIPLYHYNQMRLVDPALRGLPTQNLKGEIATKSLYFITQ